MSTPATASPGSGSLFDDEWNSFGGDGSNDYENLDDLPNLDEILGRPPEACDASHGDSGVTINPQLLNGAASPDKHGELPRSPYNGEDVDNIFVGPVAKVESFEQTSAASSRYFHPSVESFYSQAPYFQSPLRNQLHRRSVSEPPTDMLAHYLHGPPMPPIQEAPITFTRSGINLGTPKMHHGNRAANSKKPKHPHLQEPYPSHKPGAQERYQLRRAQTQPGRPGPTSAPVMMHPLHHTPLPQMMMQQHLAQPYVVPPQAVTSRVCTPVPSPPQQFHSPVQIHPGLMGSPGPSERKKVVTISLTVEELRGMITEAVKAALSGVGVRKTVEEDDVADGGAAVKGEES